MNITTSLYSFTNFVQTPNIFLNFRDMSYNLQNNMTTTIADAQKIFIKASVQYGSGTGQRIAISNVLPNGKNVIAISCATSYNSTQGSLTSTLFGGILFSKDSGSTFTYIDYGSSYNSNLGQIDMSTDASYVYHALASTTVPQLYIYKSTFDSFTNVSSVTFPNSAQIRSVCCSSNGKYVCAGGTYNTINLTVMYVSNNYGASFTAMTGSTLSSINISTNILLICRISDDGKTIFAAIGALNAPYIYRLTDVIDSNGDINISPTLLQYSSIGATTIYNMSASNDASKLIVSYASKSCFSYNTSVDVFFTSSVGTVNSIVPEQTSKMPLIVTDGFCQKAIACGYGANTSSVSYPQWYGDAYDISNNTTIVYSSYLYKKAWNKINSFPPNSTTANQIWGCCGISRDGTMAALAPNQFTSLFTINNKLYLTRPY